MTFGYELSDEHVVIQNISFDPLGRAHSLTPGVVRRWWQTRRGWSHYVGEHHLDFDAPCVHRALAFGDGHFVGEYGKIRPRRGYEWPQHMRPAIFCRDCWRLRWRYKKRRLLTSWRSHG